MNEDENLTLIENLLAERRTVQPASIAWLIAEVRRLQAELASSNKIGRAAGKLAGEQLQQIAMLERKCKAERRTGIVEAAEIVQNMSALAEESPTMNRVLSTLRAAAGG